MDLVTSSSLGNTLPPWGSLWHLAFPAEKLDECLPGSNTQAGASELSFLLRTAELSIPLRLVTSWEIVSGSSKQEGIHLTAAWGWRGGRADVMATLSAPK